MSSVLHNFRTEKKMGKKKTNNHKQRQQRAENTNM